MVATLEGLSRLVRSSATFEFTLELAENAEVTSEISAFSSVEYHSSTSHRWIGSRGCYTDSNFLGIFQELSPF